MQKTMVKISLAPMEGLTTFIWREAFREVFGNADEFYTPFISPNGNKSYQTKELREITTGESYLVPQLLSNNAEHFLWAIRDLKDRGFKHVNLNIGCPSGTVVAKHKGSGMLTDLKELAETLDEIFDFLPNDMVISIKTRVGKISIDEWNDILDVYNRYPLEKLIVHPRVQKEFYQGRAHTELFLKTFQYSKNPLVYNGDIFCAEDAHKLVENCENLQEIMIGRGALMNPAIFREIKGGKRATREEFQNYHDILFTSYCNLYGDATAVGRMKEVWNYFYLSFEEPEKALKCIRKAKNRKDYEYGANCLLKDHKIRDISESMCFLYK